jgi:hypothetical protein
MRVFELDTELLGKRLLGIVPASHKAGHEWPKGTTVYLDKSEPETEFICDLLNLSTKELVEKWYGGTEVMSQLELEASKRLHQMMRDYMNQGG